MPNKRKFNKYERSINEEIKRSKKSISADDDYANYIFFKTQKTLEKNKKDINKINRILEKLQTTRNFRT